MTVSNHKLLYVLVVAFSALIGGMDSCRNPSEAERIELGGVIRTLGDEGPLHLDVMEYRQGSAHGQIWLARIEGSRAHISLLPAKDKARPLQQVLEPLESDSDFVAINGGFYDEKGPLGLVISGGRRLKALRKDGGSGVFLVADGVAGIVHRDLFRPAADIQVALQSIDRLVAEGRGLVQKHPKMSFDARSVVAVDGLGTVYFLVLFDDRAIASDDENLVRLNREATETGTTLYALADFLARPLSEGGLQMEYALNLDGGFSSAMLVRIGGERAGVIAYQSTINVLVATPVRPGIWK